MSMLGYNFSDEDRIYPVYCVGCRTHIPRTVSNTHRGLCPACVAKINAPAPPPVTAARSQAGNQTTQPSPPPVRLTSQVSPPAASPFQISLRRLSPVTLTWIVSIGGCLCISVPVIAISNVKKAEVERQQRAVALSEAKRKLAETKAKHPAEIARRRRLEENARLVAEKQAQDRAEETKLGSKPVPSWWDGITPEANEYLRATLKDYDSLKLVECSQVAPWGADAWCQRVKYRAKNSFGAYVLEENVFVIKNGAVTNVLPY